MHEQAGSGTLDECADAARIAWLERKLHARDKTIEALMRKLENHAASNASGFAILQQNIALEDIVARKTKEVDAERREVEKALIELRAAQARLLQAQKLEAIGELAAGIAHEINTPTQYVSDNVTFLKRSFEALLNVLDGALAAFHASRSNAVVAGLLAAVDASVRDARLDWLREQIPAALDQSQEGLGRISTIVGAMKRFSHPSFGEKEPVDVPDLMRTTITVSRNEWKYVADLDTEFEDGLPLVPCLRNEISQAVLNLVINAAHAVAARVGDTGQRGHIVIGARASAGGIEMYVRDDGTGIPESIRDRVFDPFFTTKPLGKGTGQGLAIAYAAVVERHGGEVFFESEVGRGSTFFIRLPIATAAHGVEQCA